VAEWLGTVASVATLALVAWYSAVTQRQLRVLEKLYREVSKVTPGPQKEA
jgi:hypothetical protein